MMDFEAKTTNDNLLLEDDVDNELKNLENNRDNDVTMTTSTSSTNGGLDSSVWTPLQLCYGIPLFDEEINADVTRKV